MLADKTAADIQSGVEVSRNGKVTGTSHYIADWSSIGFDPEDGTNFVALHIKATENGSADGVTVVGECVPTQGSPTPAFNDDDAIFQITPNTTALKFTVSKSGEDDVVLTYPLDMTLEEE